MSPVLARLLASVGLLSPDWLIVPINRAPMTADAPLLIESQGGTKRIVSFRVDSGCSHTLLPMALAAQLGLPTTGRAHRINLGTALAATPVDVVTRTYRFWLFDRQRATPFILPVHLLVNQPANLTPLLGLAGVIEQIR